MIVHCQLYLEAKGIFPKNAESFRFNSISREDWDAFVKHTDSISLISSAWDTNVNPPANSVLSANLQNTYSKTKSFKSCVKRDVNLLTEFDEEPSLIPSNDLFLLTLALDSAQTLSLSETIASFDLISDSPSLVSTHGELHSMLRPTHANFPSPLKTVTHHLMSRSLLHQKAI